MAPAPKFSVGQANLVARWADKHYDITILRVYPYDSKRKAHKYEIRWTGFQNMAKRGALPDNESTYDERWISKKGEETKVTALTQTKRTSVKSAKRAAPVAKAKAKAAKVPGRVKAVAAARAAPSAAAPAAKSSKHKVKWQYYDPAKLSGPWHDYEVTASDMVEDVYKDWTANPHIDVRAVKSGTFNYMVDFNQMEQQNIDHSAHTKRKIRRTTLEGASAMEEAKKIRDEVQLQRQNSQKQQNAGDTVTELSKKAIKYDEFTRLSSQARMPSGWKAPAGPGDLSKGMKVQTLKSPISNYQYYDKEYLGQPATVVTTGGFPPVLLSFANGKTFYFCWQDLLVPVAQ